MNTSPESNQLEDDSSKVRSLSRVTVPGIVRRRRKPSRVTVSVRVTEEARSREEALTALAVKLKNIEEIAKKLGEDATCRIGAPVEMKHQTEKTLRTVETVSIAVEAELSLSDSDRLGELLMELITNNFQFNQPRFEHEKSTGFTQTEYEYAARQARNVAEALAVGAGCTIGPVLRITLPKQQAKNYNVRLRDWDGWESMANFHLVGSTLSSNSLTKGVLEDLLGSDIPEVVDELTVEVTYQLVG